MDGFVKICSNSLDSNLFRGSNLRQNPCLGGEFCILTKMCLGVNLKTFVHACLHPCISECAPPRVSNSSKEISLSWMEMKRHPLPNTLDQLAPASLLFLKPFNYLTTQTFLAIHLHLLDHFFFEY